ncbi:MAG: type IV pili twitching motility protein PilT [Candidatus Komeilibacteria bacterium RIFCSPLOWO2_01_FULL_52_15]|uniref:Type IV pili twitching motility protein PilT n=1 Tax=Candidatus Komeilibacteria bacterium RIFCSPLOWO2_01_FULL_52_15 TaxID=1798551 RepID=A0A1G2BRG1_9BACT|nr:MAG: type IV pili twitching motility protein PilT [Candidatus Komeilibacteria bacterium RIFCSPLOWO2_01_FULL_52_15]
MPFPIDELFKIASDKRASDLHLIVGKPPILRIDGELKELTDKKLLTKETAEKLILVMLNENQKESFYRKRELDMSHQLDGVSRYRVNLHFEKDNIGMVARVISTTIPSLDDVTMPPLVHELLQKQAGLILVTGPTGCGKSTSLAAMIRTINEERFANIITFEDPIEFIHKPIKSIIKQRQLGSDILSFAEGLKHVLRQDPNVIMVGEMRDLETIATTITLAETGHLVLATLHTHNASQTIDRIIDIFPPYQQAQVRLQLSISLSAVISQKLLPQSGGGRVAIREILVNNPAVANTVRENKIPQLRTIMQTSMQEGMTTMDQALKDALQRGLIDEPTALAYMEGA